MSNHLPNNLKPYLGSFRLSIEGKEAILDCLPSDTDTLEQTKEKLAKLVTYTYILMDETFCVDHPMDLEG
jgi:hypothetical protein